MEDGFASTPNATVAGPLPLGDPGLNQLPFPLVVHAHPAGVVIATSAFITAALRRRSMSSRQLDGIDSAGVIVTFIVDPFG